MPTLAFWNINRCVPPKRIVSLARQSGADILVLAECTIQLPELLWELNQNQERFFFPDPGLSDRLMMLSRFRSESITTIRDGHGVSIRHYNLPSSAGLLVVAVHLPSKLWNTTEDQILTSTRLRRYIREAEERVGHARTVLIGDLNMNPFEAGVVGSEGLHAVMDRRIALKGSRIIQGEQRDYFYNPMWTQLGDKGGTPPGTYFYDAGNVVNYYWNIFDQVLVRPALLELFRDDSIEIVSTLGGESLLDHLGRPNGDFGSDHLPVVLRLSETGELTK